MSGPIISLSNQVQALAVASENGSVTIDWPTVEAAAAQGAAIAQALLKARADGVESTRIKLAHDVEPFDPRDLLRRVVACLAAQYQQHRRPRHVFWAEISSATGLGSNCSAGLAQWAGFDSETGRRINTDKPHE